MSLDRMFVQLVEVTRLCRPLYWSKNVLVFVPGIISSAFTDPGLVWNAFAAFISLNAAASAGYVFNDFFDREVDGKDVFKKQRPFASRALGESAALPLAGLLFLAAMIFASRVSMPLCGAVTAYLIFSVLYTGVLRQYFLLDVAWLAGMHTFRLVIGCIAVSVVPSTWLLTYSMLFFLSLALAKRQDEITAAGPNDPPASRNSMYRLENASFINRLGLASGGSAVMVLALYTLAQAEVPVAFARPPYLWLVNLVIGLWLILVWSKARSGKMKADAVSFALKDPLSLTLGVVLVVFASLAKLTPT